MRGSFIQVGRWAERFEQLLLLFFCQLVSDRLNVVNLRYPFLNVCKIANSGKVISLLCLAN